MRNRYRADSNGALQAETIAHNQTDYVSNPSAPSNLGPRRPPLVRRGLPGEIFLMRSMAQLHTLWRDIRREVQAHYRSYTLLLHMACLKRRTQRGEETEERTGRAVRVGLLQDV